MEMIMMVMNPTQLKIYKPEMLAMHVVNFTKVAVDNCMNKPCSALKLKLKCHCI